MKYDNQSQPMGRYSPPNCNSIYRPLKTFDIDFILIIMQTMVLYYLHSFIYST